METLEFRYTRGNSALEPVVRTAREIRAEIDALAKRFEDTAVAVEGSVNGSANGSGKKAPAGAAAQRAELLSIISDMQELILRIDDSIPGINMWLSAIGGIQSQPSSFSPARLLQASYLVNVGDTQYALNPSQRVQIGPDFVLSLYMLFRGHASFQDSEEPYGIEEGQRKPMWQEAIHKTRVRLCRVPIKDSHLANTVDSDVSVFGYAYQLQVVEDLDDGRVHTFDEGDSRPTPYDGIAQAGIREFIPVGQIAKMLYTDVGRILNIHNEDGESSSPVLLLKRDTQAVPPAMHHERPGSSEPPLNSIEDVTDQSVLFEDSSSGSSSQDEIDRQLRAESVTAKVKRDASSKAVSRLNRQKPRPVSADQWKLPPDLDPEWIALEVFDFDDEDDDGTSDDDEEDQSSGFGSPRSGKYQRSMPNSHPSADPNLIGQLHRMSLAPPPGASSRPSSRGGPANEQTQQLQTRRAPAAPTRRNNTGATQRSGGDGEAQQQQFASDPIQRSPFGAIRTSLSLLEMLLRLASLQEFEQATHLAIPDHVLRFYLDSAGGAGGGGGDPMSLGRADAERRKVGFDPNVGGDSPGAGGAGGSGSGSGIGDF